MQRREFLAAGAAAAAAATTLPSAHAAPPPPGMVDFTSDGLGLAPREYAALLGEIAAAPGVEADNYSLGGAVAELEQWFAAQLGKQAALFVPTGTLANHLAVRGLAGSAQRVLVQAESHLYNDSGDAATTLSGLALVPLGEGRATLTRDDVEPMLARTRGGRVALDVGVICVENPVRRRDHEAVELAELDRLCAFAKSQGIRLHLDGARLFTLSLHTGRGVREHAAPFDTVYVSLWKHFNGAGGAILAGTAEFIDGLFHARRMFGGSLPQAWPQIAPVLRYAKTFEADYARAWAVADEVFARLARDDGFALRKLPNGTSKAFLRVPGTGAELPARALERGIRLVAPRADTGEIPVMINATLLRRPAAEIARALREAIA